MSYHLRQFIILIALAIVANVLGAVCSANSKTASLLKMSSSEFAHQYNQAVANKNADAAARLIDAAINLGFKEAILLRYNLVIEPANAGQISADQIVDLFLSGQKSLSFAVGNAIDHIDSDSITRTRLHQRVQEMLLSGNDLSLPSRNMSAILNRKSMEKTSRDGRGLETELLRNITSGAVELSSAFSTIALIRMTEPVSKREELLNEMCKNALAIVGARAPKSCISRVPVESFRTEIVRENAISTLNKLRADSGPIPINSLLKQCDEFSAEVLSESLCVDYVSLSLMACIVYIGKEQVPLRIWSCTDADLIELRRIYLDILDSSLQDS